MFNFGNKSESILRRSAANKSQFTKLRDSLLKINDEAEFEEGLITQEISKLKDKHKALFDERVGNNKVINNVNKILGSGA